MNTKTHIKHLYILTLLLVVLGIVFAGSTTSAYINFNIDGTLSSNEGLPLYNQQIDFNCELDEGVGSSFSTNTQTENDGSYLIDDFSFFHCDVNPCNFTCTIHPENGNNGIYKFGFYYTSPTLTLPKTGTVNLVYPQSLDVTGNFVPTGGTYGAGDFSFSFNPLQTVQECSYNVDSSMNFLDMTSSLTLSEGVYSSTYTPQSSGTVDFYVACKTDLIHELASYNEKVTYTFDLDAPDIQEIQPYDGTYLPALPTTIDIDADEDVKCQLVDNYDYGTINCSSTYEDPTACTVSNYHSEPGVDGAYTIDVSCVDQYNNVNNDESVTYTLDYTLPWATRNGTTFPCERTTLCDFDWELHDEYVDASHLGVYDIFIDDSSETSNSWNSDDFIVNTPDYFYSTIGFHNYTIFLRDNVGNLNYSTVNVSVIDTIAPEILGFSPPNQSYLPSYSSTISSIDLTENGECQLASTYDYTSNCTSIDGNTKECTISDYLGTPSNSGNYSIPLSCVDEYGNINNNATVFNYVIDVEKPWATLNNVNNGSTHICERTEPCILFNWILEDDYYDESEHQGSYEIFVNNIGEGLSYWTPSAHSPRSNEDIDTSAVNEFNYTIFFADYVGNQNYSYVNVSVVDTTAPIFNVDSPLNGQLYGPTITMNTTSEDNDGNQCWVNVSGINTTMTEIVIGQEYGHIDSFNNGSHTLRFYCNDTYSNTNVTDVSFMVDAEAPIIYTQYNATVSMNATDEELIMQFDDITQTGNYSVRLNNSIYEPLKQWFNSVPIPINIDTNAGLGWWNYTIFVNDSFNNINRSTVWIEVIDDVNPNITIDSPVEDQIFAFEPTFNVTVNETSSFCNLSIDYQINSTMEYNSNDEYGYINNSLSDGSHTVEFFCNDSHDNWGYNSTTFGVDLNAPYVIDYVGQPEYSMNSTGFINWTLGDDFASGSYKLITNNTVGTVEEWNIGLMYNFTVNTTAGLGVYNYTLFFNDSVGHMNSSTKWISIIDDIKPVLSVEDPVDMLYNDGSVYFNVSANEVLDFCEFSVDGASNITMKDNDYYFDNNSFVSDGNHNVTFYCNDSHNNWNSTTQNFSVDTTPAYLTQTPPSYFEISYTNNSASVYYNISDDFYSGNYTVVINTTTPITHVPLTAWQNNTEFNYTINNTLDLGMYNYTLWFNDSVNNIATHNVTVKIIDDVAPELTIEKPENITYNHSNVYFNVSLDEAGNDCVYEIDGLFNITMQPLPDNKFGNISTINDGNHTVVFYCNDSYDNLGVSETEYFSVDTTAPYLSKLPINEQISYTNGSAYLYFNISDAMSTGFYNVTLNSTNPETVYVNVTSWSNDTEISIHINNSAGLGMWKYNIWFNDSVNNIANHTVFVTIIDDVAPILFTVNPENKLYNNSNVYFNVSLNEVGSFCEFSVDGASNITMNDNVYWFDNTTFVSDGNHTVEFFCNDSHNNWNSTSRDFAVDTTAPYLTNKPASYINVSYMWNNVDLHYNISDYFYEGFYNVTINSTIIHEPLTNWYNDTDFFYTVNNTLDLGLWEYVLWFNDSMNNINSSTVLINLIDDVAPEVNYFPLNSLYNTKFVDLNLTANDYSTISHCWYNVNNSVNQTMDENIDNYGFSHEFLSDGYFEVNYYCNDSNNNIGYNYTNTSIDTTAPTVTLYPINTINNFVYTLSVDAQDNFSGISNVTYWYTNETGYTEKIGTNSTGPYFNFTWNPVPEQLENTFITINVTAMDFAGWQSENYSEQNVIVDIENSIPIAIFEMNLNPDGNSSRLLNATKSYDDDFRVDNVYLYYNYQISNNTIDYYNISGCIDINTTCLWDTTQTYTTCPEGADCYVRAEVYDDIVSNYSAPITYFVDNSGPTITQPVSNVTNNEALKGDYVCVETNLTDASNIDWVGIEIENPSSEYSFNLMTHSASGCGSGEYNNITTYGYEFELTEIGHYEVTQINGSDIRGNNNTGYYPAPKFTVLCVDGDSPEILDPWKYTGDYFLAKDETIWFRTKVTDETAVDTVLFEYSDYTRRALDNGNDFYNSSFTCLDSTPEGNYSLVQIRANDTGDYTNIKTVSLPQIHCDPKAPLINTTQYTGNNFEQWDNLCVQTNVHDLFLDQVWTEITLPDTSVINYTMSDNDCGGAVGDGIYEVNIELTQNGTWYINSSYANDTMNNLNRTMSGLMIDVVAQEDPQITNCSLNSSYLTDGEVARLNCTITDNVGLDTVWFSMDNYTQSGIEFNNHTITDNINHIYYYDFTCDANTNYFNYTILHVFANDTDSGETHESNASIQKKLFCDIFNPHIENIAWNATTANQSDVICFNATIYDNELGISGNPILHYNNSYQNYTVPMTTNNACATGENNYGVEIKLIYPGNYNFSKIVVQDIVGNTNTTWINETGIIIEAEDNTNPTIFIESPVNATYITPNVTLQFYADEWAWSNQWYSLDDGADVFINYSDRVNITGLGSGSHKITTYLNDTYNNVGNKTVYFTINTTEFDNDLHIEEFIVPSEPIVGVDYELSVNISNEGQRDAMNVQVDYYDENELFYTDTVNVLEKDSAISTAIHNFTKGTHEIRVDVEIQDNEDDVLDNTMTKYATADYRINSFQISTSIPDEVQPNGWFRVKVYEYNKDIIPNETIRNELLLQSGFLNNSEIINESVVDDSSLNIVTYNITSPGIGNYTINSSSTIPGYVGNKFTNDTIEVRMPKSPIFNIDVNIFPGLEPWVESMVIADISNYGNETAYEVNATIILSNNIELRSGEYTEEYTESDGNLDPGEDWQIIWTVMPNATGTYNVTVEAACNYTTVSDGQTSESDPDLFLDTIDYNELVQLDNNVTVDVYMDNFGGQADNVEFELQLGPNMTGSDLTRSLNINASENDFLVQFNFTAEKQGDDQSFKLIINHDNSGFHEERIEEFNVWEDLVPPNGTPILSGHSTVEGYSFIQWTPISGVSQYYIYVGKNGQIDFNPETPNATVSATTTSWIDTHVDINKWYYYRVAPVDDVGNVGNLSEYIRVIPVNTDELEDAIEGLQEQLSHYEDEEQIQEQADDLLAETNANIDLLYEDMLKILNISILLTPEQYMHVNAIKQTLSSAQVETNLNDRVAYLNQAEYELSNFFNDYSVGEQEYSDIQTIDSLTIDTSTSLLTIELGDETNNKYTVTRTIINPSDNIVENISLVFDIPEDAILEGDWEVSESSIVYNTDSMEPGEEYTFTYTFYTNSEYDNTGIDGFMQEIIPPTPLEAITGLIVFEQVDEEGNISWAFTGFVWVLVLLGAVIYFTRGKIRTIYSEVKNHLKKEVDDEESNMIRINLE